MSRPITSEILDRTDLKSSEKLVLVAIASHGTNAFPSQHRLAKLTSLSLRTIKAICRRIGRFMDGKMDHAVVSPSQHMRETHPFKVPFVDGIRPA